MDIMYANQITSTQKLCYESLQGVFPKALKVIVSVLSILCVIFSVVMYCYRDIFLFAVLLIFGIVMFFYLGLLLRLLAKRLYQQQVIINSGTEMQRTVEFADRIRCSDSNGAEWLFDYAQVTHLYETKHLLILKVSRTLNVSLEKGNFTVGDVGSFREFIRQRCPSAHYTLRRF